MIVLFPTHQIDKWNINLEVNETARLTELLWVTGLVSQVSKPKILLTSTSLFLNWYIHLGPEI